MLIKALLTFYSGWIIIVTETIFIFCFIQFSSLYINHLLCMVCWRSPHSCMIENRTVLELVLVKNWCFPESWFLRKVRITILSYKRAHNITSSQLNIPKMNSRILISQVLLMRWMLYLDWTQGFSVSELLMLERRFLQLLRHQSSEIFLIFVFTFLHLLLLLSCLECWRNSWFYVILRNFKLEFLVFLFGGWGRFFKEGPSQSA